MTARVVCFGEMVIDFVSVERGVSVGQASGFSKAPGGAPANVAVGLAKLGIPTAFMSQLGDDPFGHYLAGVLKDHAVDISALRFTDRANTTLAFVSVEKSGERSFTFYRKPSADMLMTEADLGLPMLAAAHVFHFGSITLIDDPIHSTTLAAVKHAQQNGALISYDPNLREHLWPNLDTAREGMKIGLDFADIVKVSEEELHFLTGETDIASGVQQLWRDVTQLILVTKGEFGSAAYTRDHSWEVPGFRVAVEDTIGAGDGFVAGMLSGLLAMGDSWQGADFSQLLRRANAVGALTASRQGGIPALPTASELDSFLAKHAK
jgi:fructokinase